MATFSASKDQRLLVSLIARVATGIVLGCFGFWELTDPGQWTGYVPPVAAAVVSPVSLILLHGWILFVLAAAALIDFAAPVTSWIAAAVMAEVVLGLLLSSGFTDILVRDIGLLALALVWTLDARPDHQPDPAPRAAPARSRGRGQPGTP